MRGIENPWTRNTPDAPWSEQDEPDWWDVQEGLMEDLKREMNNEEESDD